VRDIYLVIVVWDRIPLIDAHKEKNKQKEEFRKTHPDGVAAVMPTIVTGFTTTQSSKVGV
jgi:hypothetical protein